jgi:hypothetical protein
VIGRRAAQRARRNALREAAAWVRSFDVDMTEWPDELRLDRPTVRRIADGLDALATLKGAP